MMLSWSAKKKLHIFIGLFLSLLLVAVIIYFIFFKEKPNCFDHLKNGNEEGIDCGGDCSEVCSFHASTINTLWAKAFLVKDGVYNIIAILENPNFDYKINADYILNAYNRKGVLSYKHSGTIELSAAEKRAFFLPSVISKNEEISKIFVKFPKINSLQKDQKTPDKIKIISRNLTEEFGQTKLNIKLKNDSLETIKKIEVIAVLYDYTGNAQQIGKTFIKSLNKREEEEVFITWPGSISKEVNVIDIFTKELKTLNGY